MSTTGYAECRPLSGLSNLRVLDISSRSPPSGLVSHLSLLEQLTWSPEWRDEVPRETFTMHFVSSLKKLRMLRSLTISGQGAHVCPWKDAVLIVTELTSLTYLSVGVFPLEHVSCLSALERLGHLKVLVAYECGFQYRRLHSLALPPLFEVIDSYFLSLSLTGLTHLELGMDRGWTRYGTSVVAWESQEAGSFRSPETGRLQFERVTSLSLNGTCCAPSDVSHILRHVPSLTSFTTDKKLTNANIAVLAGLTQLKKLDFALSSWATEGFLLMLTRLTGLTHLSCQPLSDDPNVWPAALTSDFVAAMNAHRFALGWPVALELA
jgi:hypothetical protein